MVTVTDFNVLDYLGNEGAMQGYLQGALEEEGPEGFLDAAADVMKARTLLLLSKKTGIGYKDLCLAFTGRGGSQEIAQDVLKSAAEAFAAPVLV